MAFEQFIQLEFSDYGDGVMLNEYNGMISLVSARKGKENGTNYMQWCFPQDKDREPKKTAVPWGIKLGNREQAAKVLYQLAAALSSKAPPEVFDDDPPF